MLSLAIAMSSAPQVFAPIERWEELYNQTGSGPNLQPFLIDGGEVVQVEATIDRVTNALAVLRGRLEGQGPNLIVVIAPARGHEAVSAPSVGFNVFRGDLLGDLESAENVMRCDPAAGARLSSELSARGFPQSEEPTTWSKASARGVVDAVRALDPSATSGIVPILVNTAVPPMPSSQQCWDLGLALRECLSAWRENTVLLATGGLSHDALGRWVDEPLDQAVLGKVVSSPESLKKLFAFDSETLAGRTGELRTWVAAAGAEVGTPQVIDYVASRQAKTGLGFVVWD